MYRDVIVVFSFRTFYIGYTAFEHVACDTHTYTYMHQRRSSPSAPGHGHGLPLLWTCGGCGWVWLLVDGVVVFVSGVELHGFARNFLTQCGNKGKYGRQVA